MKKYLNDFLVFYRKYRWWVIGGLFFLLMMQICSQGGRVNQSLDVKKEVVQSEEIVDDGLLQPLGASRNEDIKPQQNPSLNSIFILVIFGLLFYIAMKRGLFKKFAPSIVWVTLGLKRLNNQRLAKIGIVNQTKESKTFQAPVIVFAGIGQKTKRFKLKTNLNSVFPLTLTPGTSHQLTINIDQFRTKANLTNSYKLVKIEVESDGVKEHSSFWKFLF
ncbi:hypothetical protein [Carboxylicivirga sp. N1Y90]|uniref:hypothetical protein n=1 Tax=Carboxylicivirga fragile TaxID=3417571 RepID=UPI003D3365B8|nr:hypothetical protein [Marinilabiliaceae bacterium N1Y90]